MKFGCIVKGRRFYSPKLGEYVVAVKRRQHLSSFQTKTGGRIRIGNANVWYLDDADYQLCCDLARSARMEWFNPFLDESGTETNNDFGTKGSFRNAVRDMSEGLVFSNFEMMANPAEANSRFRKILRGMGIPDYGDYC